MEAGGDTCIRCLRDSTLREAQSGSSPAPACPHASFFSLAPPAPSSGNGAPAALARGGSGGCSATDWDNAAAAAGPAAGGQWDDSVRAAGATAAPGKGAGAGSRASSGTAGDPPAHNAERGLLFKCGADGRGCVRSTHSGEQGEDTQDLGDGGEGVGAEGSQIADSTTEPEAGAASGEGGARLGSDGGCAGERDGEGGKSLRGPALGAPPEGPTATASPEAARASAAECGGASRGVGGDRGVGERSSRVRCELATEGCEACSDASRCTTSAAASSGSGTPSAPTSQPRSRLGNGLPASGLRSTHGTGTGAGTARCGAGSKDRRLGDAEEGTSATRDASAAAFAGAGEGSWENRRVRRSGAPSGEAAAPGEGGERAPQGDTPPCLACSVLHARAHSSESAPPRAPAPAPPGGAAPVTALRRDRRNDDFRGRPEGSALPEYSRHSPPSRSWATDRVPAAAPCAPSPGCRVSMSMPLQRASARSSPSSSSSASVSAPALGRGAARALGA